MLYRNKEGSAFCRTDNSRKADRLLSLGYIPVEEVEPTGEEKPKRGKKAEQTSEERVIEA